LKIDTPNLRRWLLFEAALITNEVYVEIQLLKKHGKSLRQIAKEVGCAVNTVRRHLDLAQMPTYERQSGRVAKLAQYESYLRDRQAAAKPSWIPATVLYREITEKGYQGGMSQLRAFLRTLRPTQTTEPVIRFETAAGEQMQVDWVEFRKGADPLYAFCATLGYSRASYVEFVTDMKVDTLIGCHEGAFQAFGGVVKRVLYDNMKTVVIERDAYGQGEHRLHAAFLDYAKHSGFIIKLCRPYRAKTKGKVERFNGYLRRSFYVPLVSRLRQAGLKLDVVTANEQVRRWLDDIAHERIHGTTGIKPSERLQEERPYLQALPQPWRADIAAARPQRQAPDVDACTRPPVVMQRLSQEVPIQHALCVYERLLQQIVQGAAA
jgi:transposase